MSQRYLILDYETRSEADLKKCGPYKYSLHPSTKILCAAWRIGTKEELRDAPIHSWSPALSMFPLQLINDLGYNRVTIVAHNALFEQVITKNVLYRHVKMMHDLKVCQHIPISRWFCTAAQAATFALPRKLEGACNALNLSIKKDMEGNRLIQKMCKPRKPTKNNPAKWHNKLSDLKRIMEYCCTDVAAETELFLSLPELNPIERKIWELDQKINLRGFQIDTDLVDKILEMIKLETGVLDEETSKITRGQIYSTTQRDETLNWIKNQGIFLSDLQAKTVSDALQSGIANPEVSRILQIRQSIAKTSTKKYWSFKNRVNPDNRIRDILMYHGASTGRWTGTGVQPQNFPQGKIKDVDTLISILKTGDLELIRLIYGNPMDAFSSCLRSVIMAPKGKKLLCADFAAIEARVLFWLANHESGLKAYLENRDLYREMATNIYSKNLDEVTKPEREVAKRAVLGCGYGMGPDKFGETCKQYGMEVTEELARLAVQTYREVHWPVPKLWNNLIRAAMEAVKNKGRVYKINRTKWFFKDRFLFCELPSGRRLAYFGPHIKQMPTPWGEKMPKLYYWGVDPYTKKWSLQSTYGGHLCENVTQATARDLMALGMLRIDETGRYDLNLTVHDEILAEADIDKGNIKEFESLMAELPSWARGCPVKAEGWESFRYHK